MPDWILPTEEPSVLEIETMFDQISIKIDENPDLRDMAGAPRSVLQQHAEAVVGRVSKAADEEGICREHSEATLYTMGWIMGYHWAKRGS